MKNILNFRFFVVVFLSLMAGIFAVISFYENTKILFYVSFGGLILLLCYLVVCLIINKPYFLFTKLKTICILTIITTFILGALFAHIKVQTFNPKQITEKVFVEGKIASKHISSSDNYYLILKNVKINNSKTKYNVVVYYENDYNFEEGYIISFNSNLKTNKLITLSGLNTFISSNNLGYTAFAYSIKTESTKVNFLEKFKINVSNILFNNMSEENAGLSKAVLFGDKSNLNSDIKQSFTASGVAHLLAISGLHVGIFIAVLYFVLNKFKVKRYITFIVSCIILLLFNILCNFTESVVRASLMSLCLLVATCFGKRGDSLSNLSLAGIILLLVNPLNLYEIGFELSFLAVFGILLLLKPINNLLLKIKSPKILAGATATTVSATIFTLPVVANTFGVMAVSLIPANLILIPLFTAFYITLLLGLIIAFIPFLSFALAVPNFLSNIMLSFTNIFEKLGSFNLISFGILVTIIWLVIFTIISKYTMLKPINKTLCICTLIIILSVALIVPNSKTQEYNNDIFVYNNVQNCSLVTTSSGNNYLMNVGDGDKADLGNITELLHSLKINKIKAVIICNYEPSMQKNIGEFLLEFQVESIYIPLNLENYNLFGLRKNLKSEVKINLIDFKETNYLENDLYIYGVYSSGNTCKYLIYSLNEKVVCQFVSRLSDLQLTTLKEQVKENKIDILIQASVDKRYENTFWLGECFTVTNTCYLENFEKVVINSSYYAKINTRGVLNYEIY